MSDIVIRCPHKCHDKPVKKIVDGKEVSYTPEPKMLLIASASSVGEFKVQCTGATPGAHGNNRGWYLISLNGCGGYKLRAIPRQKFDLHKVPYVVED